MATLGNGNAPDGQVRGVDADAAITLQGRRRERTAPVALVGYATRYRQGRGQQHDWAVVRSCPLCRRAHRHVIFEESARTIERSPGCAPHRRYVLEFTAVVPAVTSTGRAA